MMCAVHLEVQHGTLHNGCGYVVSFKISTLWRHVGYIYICASLIRIN